MTGQQIRQALLRELDELYRQYGVWTVKARKGDKQASYMVDFTINQISAVEQCIKVLMIKAAEEEAASEEAQ